MNLPPHIQRALIADGTITETGLTHTPQPRTCPHCGHRTLTAIDDLGTDATTWAWPTTTIGELTALLTGLRTWHRNTHGELTARGPHTITAKPANRYDVHTQHRCDDPPPPAKPTPPPATTTPPPTKPPF